MLKVTKGLCIFTQSLKNGISSKAFRLRPFECSCLIYRNGSYLSSRINYNTLYFKNNSFNVEYSRKQCFSSNVTQSGLISKIEFENICNETLESLSEYFEEIIENNTHLKGSDVAYSDGVLTVQFGNDHGTYVINRQTPNHQIWLSSPTSGPKRYDFVHEKRCWIYRHDNRSLHELLQEEIPKIVKTEVNFLNCNHSGL